MIRQFSLGATFIVLGVTLCISAAFAQQNAPRIAYDYPAGGSQGSNVTVIVGGQYLQSAVGARFSGEGVHATFVSYYRPLTQREYSDFQDKLIAAQTALIAAGGHPGPVQPDNVVGLPKIAHNAGLTDSDLASYIEYVRIKRDTLRQMNPQLAERVTLTVRIDADASPGPRELRLDTRLGLTNIVHFVVGTIPEIAEVKSNMAAPIASPPPTVISSSLPIELNGQILPGEVDHYTFHGTKNMLFSAVCDAQGLMPYIADTVPGWFQPAMSLSNSQGHELAYSDHYLFYPDPELVHRLPADGDYTLEVRDALYRGREDFIYRVGVGVPVADRPVLSTNSSLEPSSFSSLPQTPYRAGNHTSAHAQLLLLPTVTSGIVSAPGEKEVYEFRGQTGETVVAEIQARRLGSPLHSIIKLTDHTGKLLAMNDGTEDKGAALVTDQADSYVMQKLPANGNYYVIVWDDLGKGGADYGYLLRLSEPIPDFDLRISPSLVNVRAGAACTFTATVIRRDGFSGNITMALGNKTKQFSLSGAVIPGKADSSTMALHVPAGISPGVYAITMSGTAAAQPGASSFTREAIPADDMMQAFAYHHLVPADECLVTVLPRGPAAKPKASVPPPASHPLAATFTPSAAEQRPPATSQLPKVTRTK